MSGALVHSIDLQGKVAIVTGAGRGIGQAIAEALARNGAGVAVTARTEPEILDTASRIQEAGGRAVAIPGDVSDYATVQRWVLETERRLGSVDILVNNAGVSGVGGPFWESDPVGWWRTLEVNLLGPMLCSRAVLPGMIARRRGTIINVGSNAGIRPLPGNSAYGTSKAALLRFSESLAAAVAEYSIRVFAMSPGLVRTRSTENVPIFHNLPESEWRPAERAGELTVRLASGEADALSGCFLHVDDDLSELLREAKRIRGERLYTLRLVGLDGPKQ